MGIESTFDIYRGDAIEMLKQKNITVFDDDCNDRLELLIYENRESIFENYAIQDFNEENAPSERYFRWKTSWKY